MIEVFRIERKEEVRRSKADQLPGKAVPAVNGGEEVSCGRGGIASSSGGARLDPWSGFFQRFFNHHLGLVVDLAALPDEAERRTTCFLRLTSLS